MKKLTSCFLLVFFWIAASAQLRNNNSLLWRISGNGISKPSYLFGTMHVYDKKAFNFKDSLYTFLEQVEGLALEFNPDSANMVVEAYLNGSIRTDIDERSAPPDISSSDLKLMQKKISAGKLDYAKKDEKSMVDYFVARLLASDKKQKNSMNTFMDAFLYEIAKQYEKKMYGLEALNSQIGAMNSLSKGLKIKKFVNLLDKWSPEDESPIAELYYRENIDSINIFFANYFTEETLDDFLYKRNKVMAAKMDSLMRLQSMFTAVGAGHLSGGKGIIALLKQKGYTVEPVFSLQRIPASEYKLKRVERPGYVVRNEEMGLEYEMPGQPNTQEGEAGRSIVFYYDLGGGLLYMTICGKVSSKDSKKNSEEIATYEFNKLISNIDGKILSSKIITAQGLKGMEILCLGKNNIYYRMYGLVSKNMFYALSLTSQKKDNLYSENAEKYLASFKLIPIPPSQWTTYEFPEDGFRISLPGKPRIEPVKTEPGSNVSINSYSYFDANSAVNYTITSGKTKAYNEYISNESFFEGYLQHIRSGVIKGEPVIADTTINNFPGKKFSRPSENNAWKGFVIKRNHTSYFLVAEFEPGTGDDQAEKFLQSFSLINYRKPDWQLKNSPLADFLSWVPSDIHQKKYDSSETYLKDEKEYYAYDPYSGITYFINAEPVSEYYWAPNEDSIYNYWKNKTISEWSDSLISYTAVKNGGITGRELVYANKNDKIIKRRRLLINGHTMYSLYITLPPVFADETNINLFFDDFKIAEEKNSDEILNNTPDKLFTDLKSPDSTIFQKAYNALSVVKFDRKQLILLVEKALAEYPEYKNNYVTVNDKLLATAGDLFQNAEPSAKKEVISFIENNYSKPGRATDGIRFHLLGIVAKDKTQEAYGLIKKLLAEKLPSKGSDYQLFNQLDDSLDLTKILYPELLQYISDTAMGMPVAALTKKMIDSNIISIDMVQARKNDVLKLARRQLKHALKAENDDYSYDYRIIDLISLMGMMKQNEMDILVAEFLKAKPVSIKKEAILALIKNNKPVAATIIKQVSNDKYERANFYDDLKKINKVSLFPPEFRSQQKLAESYIYQYLADDEQEVSDAELIYIKKIEYSYKGEKKRFYFFRVNFPQEPDTSDNEAAETRTNSYLAIAGPFELDINKPGIEREKNITGTYYDEKFDGMMMDDYFKKFIEERLKWQQ
jgi:uncharacterized protein YbaP (TraB family)